MAEITIDSTTEIATDAYPETLSGMLKGGFRIWKSNLSTSGGYLIYYILSSLLFWVGILCVVIPFLLTPPFKVLLTDPSEFHARENMGLALLEAFSYLGFSGIFLIIFVVAAICVLYYSLSVFFTAGVCNMICDAVISGKCSIKTLFRYGKENFGPVFYATILEFLFLMAFSMILSTIFSFILMFVCIPLMLIASDFIDIALTILYFLCVAGSFFLTSAAAYYLNYIIYAAAVDKGTVSDNLQNGLAFANKNRKIILKFGILYGIAEMIILLFQFIGIPVIFTLVQHLIISPITDCCSIRLYMKENGKLQAAVLSENCSESVECESTQIETVSEKSVNDSEQSDNECDRSENECDQSENECGQSENECDRSECKSEVSAKAE